MENKDTNELLFYASTTSNSLIRKRCKAVFLVLDGESKSAVSEELVCSRTSIHDWVKIYKDIGIYGLLSTRNEKDVKNWLNSFPEVISRVSQENPDKNIEVYFQDETRFGQQGILVRQWSEVGNRPVRERQIEYKNAWIFGAVNPLTGAHHGIVTTHAATDFMQEFIDSFSLTIQKKSHAVLILDNASWHHSADLSVPKNITLHFLPPYSPELNPSECLWKFIKSRFLCNRLYGSLEEIIEAGVEAWRKVTSKIVQSVCACNFLPTCVFRGF